jgi:hypothetical protein
MTAHQSSQMLVITFGIIVMGSVNAEFRGLLVFEVR